MLKFAWIFPEFCPNLPVFGRNFAQNLPEFKLSRQKLLTSKNTKQTKQRSNLPEFSPKFAGISLLLPEICPNSYIGNFLFSPTPMVMKC